MANNLDIEQLAENQAAPEVSVNDATLALQQALTEQFAVDLTSGNVTITRLEYQRNVLFNCTGVATTGRTVTLGTIVPIRGLTLFQCAAANTNNISLVCGSTSVTLKPGHLYAVSTDGTANGMAVIDLGNTSGEANDVHVFVPGIMDNAQLLYRQKVTRPFTLPASLTGSFVTAVTAATGSTTITLKKNGSSIGTAVFAGSGTTATLTFASAVSFAAGDVFTIEGPATADATLADTSLDLFGTR